jgi:2,3-bisphosphoglycerate-independent phosphoglycerate mutase
MNDSAAPKFAILAVLDGWGIAAPGAGNAISQANTVNINRLMASYPHTQLAASGESVGLPHGEAGNTETGHLNLGAGRIVYQDLARINMSIADGTFFTNPTILESFLHAKKFNSAVHLMGLIGAGGVHSNLEHLFALLHMANMQGFRNVFIHLFTDGRDSPSTAAKIYIESIRNVIKREGVGVIASIMGRYWAMDRDHRWDRTEKAYLALTRGIGNLVKVPEEAIDSSYENGKTDEFIEPALISDPTGKPVKLVTDNDAVIFFNFRIDRPRQLSRAFVLDDPTREPVKDFDPYTVKYSKSHLVEKQAIPDIPFKRGDKLKNLLFVTMTEYSKPISAAGAKVAYPPELVDMPLGRVISDNGYKQLRASESEKERFVTFYFNGQQEMILEGEERLIVPSPAVATYDLKPEMSARELTSSILNKLKMGSDYKFILVNFANADMCGHSGSIGATVKACEVVDECVGKLASWVMAYDGVLFITADHGNAEEMIDAHTGQIDTEHNSSNVPFIAISKNFVGRPDILPQGVLADVAPTILSTLKLSTPSQMNGRNLLENLE